MMSSLESQRLQRQLEALQAQLSVFAEHYAREEASISEAMRSLGSRTSWRKAEASRKNGKLGGRPRKDATAAKCSDCGVLLRYAGKQHACGIAE